MLPGRLCGSCSALTGTLGPGFNAPGQAQPTDTRREECPGPLSFLSQPGLLGAEAWPCALQLTWVRVMTRSPQIVDGYEPTTTRTSRCCGAVLGRALICVTDRGLNDEPRVPC